MATEAFPVLDPSELAALGDDELRDTVRAYLRGLLPEAWLDAVYRNDRDALRAARGTLDLSAWWKALAASGLAAPRWEIGRGGLGLSGSRARIVTGELRRVRAPRTTNPVGMDLVGPVLMRHGSDEQKALLARIASHEEIWCELFSEPGAGSWRRTRCPEPGSTSTRCH